MAENEQLLFQLPLPLAPSMGRGLTKDDETLWFRRRDYALDKINKNEDKLYWEILLQHCRNFLCGSNMAMASSFAIKFGSMSRGNSIIEDELLSEAREALMRAVDKFSLSFKTRFGTFAYSVLRRAVTRKAIKETKQQQRFISGTSAMMGRGDERYAASQELSEEVEELLRALEAAPLSQAERNVVEMRFRGGMKLEAIGKVMSLSKERIRQIQESALAKLRVEMGVTNVD